MKFNIINENGKNIAEIASGKIIIKSTQDALDLMVNPKTEGAKSIIVHKENIVPEFFNLKTGLAGEILQKFVNYQRRLAIVGDFKNITSESLKAFIIESNRGNHIFFVENIENAKKMLGKD
jgi:hypothetical protein